MKKRFEIQRGFTLVELMVALAGGLVISMAVFAVAKQSSQFSASQTRVSDAMLQSMIGFERLQADIGRAGFLSTPNITRDRMFCGNIDGNYPTWLARLGSIFIEDAATSQLSPEIEDNGLAPKNIVITGSYGSADQFEVMSIPEFANPPVVLLNPDSLGMANIGFAENPTQATLDAVFAPGRALRIVDTKGFFQFVVIAGTTATPPAIVLKNAPAVEFRADNPLECGVAGQGTGAMVNVVNIVRYSIGTLDSDDAYKPVYAGGPFSEVTRRELIREELDVDGISITGSKELVAEYAVDLDFRLLVENTGTGALSNESGTDSRWAGIEPSGTTSPQFIRAVRAWLSIRSREADRTTGLTLTTAGDGPRLLRINLRASTSPLPPAFARVRSQQALISLTNQDKIVWQ